MLGRFQRGQGDHNRPFKSHYRARQQPPPQKDVESSYFSAPSKLRHQDRSVQQVSQIHSHPAVDVSYEVPLDAFDKQLLAELPQEPQEPIGPYRTRASLPQARANRTEADTYGDALRSELPDGTCNVADVSGDLHDIGQSMLGAYSPVDPASSPTVAALQNRRTGHPPVDSRRSSIEFANPQNLSEPVAYEKMSSRQAPKRPSGTDLDTEPTQKKRAVASLDSALRTIPSHGPPVIRGIQLVPTSDMPDKIRTVFPYEVLNAIQSQCYPTAFQSDDNLVVSAPTGSGKTAIMELAVCRLRMTCNTTDFKIVYQAPTKALCSERYHDWETKFRILDLQCAELTGDTDYDHLSKVQQANIIITTPEKWDSVTRKWRDNIKLVQLIKLFLVDEVHMLKDQRGATLEAVISRMKSMGTDVRFVALSATIPNSEDIATWLGKNAATRDEPAVREVFDESFRPVRLDQHVFGYQCNGNEFALDSMLRNLVPDYIAKYGKNKPTMVFCMTRKSAAQTAKALAESFSRASRQSPWPRPAAPVAVGDADLRQIVATGVAFHHGGLSSEDRSSVEKGFLEGRISVLCSTSTLAVGVNLPCYLVILQGTSTWSATGAQPYSDLEIMQMLGRAGRPQYETSACAVILTRDHQVSRYQNLVTGQEMLESTLHRNLMEHLNAEIGLGTIYDKESAQRWLASTFLRVRIARNPTYYRLEASDRTDADTLLQHLCDQDIALLLNAGLISGQESIKCTPLGEAMARYLVKFETMKAFVAIPPRAKMSDVLLALVQAVEFFEVRFRAGEKGFYKGLNKHNDIMFPINVDIASTSHKISLMLQAELGGVSLPDGDAHKNNLRQYGIEKNIAFQHAKRLIRCIIDCQLHMKDSTSAKNALELGRSISARAWDRTPRQLKQLPDIGDVSVRKLAARGIQRIDDLLNSEPHQIEMALGRPPTFGNKLLKKLETYPILRVSVREQSRSMRPGKGADLRLLCQIGFLNEKIPTVFGKTAVYVCFLVEDSNGNVIDFRRFAGAKIGTGEDVYLTVHLEAHTTTIRCHVMCDDILGTARYADLQVKDIPASVFPPSGNGVSKKHNRNTLNDSDRVAETIEFADDGVEDNDLIAMSIQGEIEAFDDIDDVLLAAENDPNPLVKNVARKPSTRSDDDEATRWKEPKKLPNGRWTCQHDCAKRGLECKHKCCLEGVNKPKKRPAKPTKGDAADGQQPKITSVPGISNISAKRAAPKIQSVDVASLAEEYTRDEDDTVGSIMRGFRVGKASEDRLQTSNGRRSPSSADLQMINYDSGTSKSAESEQSQQAITTDPIFDVEEDAFDAVDCDWPPSYQIGDDLMEDDWAAADSGLVPPESILATKHAISAPISHVSMRDIQILPDPETRRPRQHSSPGSDCFATPMHQNVLDESAFEGVFDDDPGFALDSVRTPASIDVATPDFGDTLSDYLESHFDEPMPAFELAQAASKQETEEEQQQRLQHEDQMRRWAKLPKRMYEEYGSVCTLTD